MPRAPVTRITHGPPAVSGNTIAGIATEDIGHPYVWGQWDCSGAVNHWLSKAGCPIPGYGPGKFRGPPPHGPVVAQYATWRGATSIDGPPEPGDLCVWVGLGPGGHIGIAVSGTEMVSALNSQAGTVRTKIQGEGPAGAPLIFRRVHSVAPGSGAILPPGGCGPAVLAGLITIGELASWLTQAKVR